MKCDVAYVISVRHLASSQVFLPVHTARHHDTTLTHLYAEQPSLALLLPKLTHMQMIAASCGYLLLERRWLEAVECCHAVCQQRRDWPEMVDRAALSSVALQLSAECASRSEHCLRIPLRRASYLPARTCGMAESRPDTLEMPWRLWLERQLAATHLEDEARGDGSQ